MAVSVKVRGVEELRQFFKELPRGTMRDAIKAATEYLIGNESHGLKHLVNYKYVSRKSAYGVTFFSDRQRRWFFAALADGRINPGVDNRTGKTSAGWTYSTTNNGYQTKIYNETQGAKYVQSDAWQARQPAKVGHRKVSDVISTNIKGAMQAAERAVQKWIDEHSKKA
jgi:hypothetical protein